MGRNMQLRTAHACVARRASTEFVDSELHGCREFLGRTGSLPTIWSLEVDCAGWLRGRPCSGPTFMPFPESQTLTSSRLCPIDGQLPCTYETDPSGAVHLVTALTSEQKIKEKVRGSRILMLKLDMVSPGIFKCTAMIVAEDYGDDLRLTVRIIV